MKISEIRSEELKKNTIASYSVEAQPSRVILLDESNCTPGTPGAIKSYLEHLRPW